MKALILSAGQGSRLLPLTADRPKCLLTLNSLRLLEWQVRELQRCGVAEIVVVVGFKAELVEAVLAGLARPGLRLRTVLNPFYQVADNLSTCWMAREEMGEDFLLVNGDTIFEAGVPARLLAQAAAPITVAIDQPASYDSDDMKVRLAGASVLQIGKWLASDKADGESIGMMLFRGSGPNLFAEELERVIRAPEGLDCWYTSAIDTLARRGDVGAVSIKGLQWCEVDFPIDLERARDMVHGWTTDDTLHSRIAT